MFMALLRSSSIEKRMKQFSSRPILPARGPDFKLPSEPFNYSCQLGTKDYEIYFDKEIPRFLADCAPHQICP